MGSRTRVLKLSGHDPEMELEFELRYLRSLTTRQRFRLMELKSREIRRLLGERGYRRTVEVVKRAPR